MRKTAVYAHVSDMVLTNVSLECHATLAGLPWVWGFPWVWVWYGDCDESPWVLWVICGDF